MTTSFQKECIDRTRDFLRNSCGIERVEFREVKGKRETYFLHDWSVAGHLIEIYVYTDEAGFMTDGKKWTICEKPDYDSEDALITGFLKKLEQGVRALAPQAC